MNIPVFELERIQSIYENEVQYNLTESGFHPYSLHELLSESQQQVILETTLGYGHTKGSPEIREKIANLYKDCQIENVLVTNGSSEANFVASHILLNPDDELVMMVPNYMQIWGTAIEIGAKPITFPLQATQQWKPDLNALRRVVTEKTKMIAICNPNNPTGYVLSSQEMEEIVEIASSVGAWIFSDEVYRGAELSGVECNSFWGMYEKVMVGGGLSKAYALPGLRIGWLVSHPSMIETAWTYRDYTSITAGVLSHAIGAMALEPSKRTNILARNRTMLRENLALLDSWLQTHPTQFTFIPPMAGGMAFIQYHFDINSTKFSDWLREQKSVFILPGDCYGMDGFIRIGIGAEIDFLREGLSLITEGLSELLGI